MVESTKSVAGLIIDPVRLKRYSGLLTFKGRLIHPASACYLPAYLQFPIRYQSRVALHMQLFSDKFDGALSTD